MQLKYARLDAIIKRLAGRITVVDIVDYGISGVTETQIGTDLIFIVGDPIEEFMELYISMVYETPLQLTHPFLSNIAERLIIAEVYGSYYPVQSETTDNVGSYSSVLRQQALNDFQILFDGLGIFVPGATNISSNFQNDETKYQMIVKPVILKGEILKQYIGYDYNGDGLTDTDLFKLNSNVSPSFYTTDNIEKQIENYSTDTVVNNIQTRPWRKIHPREAEINFY